MASTIGPDGIGADFCRLASRTVLHCWTGNGSGQSIAIGTLEPIRPGCDFSGIFSAIGRFAVQEVLSNDATADRRKAQAGIASVSTPFASAFGRMSMRARLNPSPVRCIGKEIPQTVPSTHETPSRAELHSNGLDPVFVG